MIRENPASRGTETSAEKKYIVKIANLLEGEKSLITVVFLKANYAYAY